MLHSRTSRRQAELSGPSLGGCPHAGRDELLMSSLPAALRTAPSGRGRSRCHPMRDADQTRVTTRTINAITRTTIAMAAKPSLRPPSGADARGWSFVARSVGSGSGIVRIVYQPDARSNLVEPSSKGVRSWPGSPRCRARRDVDGRSFPVVTHRRCCRPSRRTCRPCPDRRSTVMSPSSRGHR